ncbi:uncharacterized protein LOC130511527 isoform X2 [Raphanus sativus]|uniref:Uncharacterized protein LOC130511527 isoform X2 n=1 Tax=Raphanus sativus TaxID=3726 RepID=A0A9W3DLE2_RAPSA|nr:uncharacterized protein LOC130511527 isoform X2 [Raphanus sativus]
MAIYEDTTMGPCDNHPPNSDRWISIIFIPHRKVVSILHYHQKSYHSLRLCSISMKLLCCTSRPFITTIVLQYDEITSSLVKRPSSSSAAKEIISPLEMVAPAATSVRFMDRYIPSMCSSPHVVSAHTYACTQYV